MPAVISSCVLTGSALISTLVLSCRSQGMRKPRLEEFPNMADVKELDFFFFFFGRCFSLLVLLLHQSQMPCRGISVASGAL